MKSKEPMQAVVLVDGEGRLRHLISTSIKAVVSFFKQAFIQATIRNLNAHNTSDTMLALDHKTDLTKITSTMTANQITTVNLGIKQRRLQPCLKI